MLPSGPVSRAASGRDAERFLLKGALLFDRWVDIPNRPTRDADLLGFGPAVIPRMAAVFRDLCAAGFPQQERA